ncbi:HlyD family efflux transporter periplasmic adaptor subunit [Pseudogemmobacter humi]|uniref:Efflux pump membrane fusion protein n=1 Tax=Pseudogemmobacter humi TaxID=2483812 RepID=A0A3P5X270_9RHOB|nr:HlyD family efflux transporter periplasmic adaptor subunit [Pseudogemmobacter humi]VDC24706.1 hypothetical protein XINFAN_01275 [Pseudogemmobacter humi]
MRPLLYVAAAALALTAAVIALALRPGAGTTAPPGAVALAKRPPDTPAPEAYRSCFLLWASEIPVIAQRDGLARMTLAARERVVHGTALLHYREEEETTRLAILDLRADSLVSRAALAEASLRETEARLQAEAAALSRRLKRAEQNEDLLAARHREGRVDRLTLDQAADQHAELRETVARTDLALSLLHAEHAQRLAELRVEQALLDAEREALETARDQLVLRAEAEGVITDIAPQLAAGGLAGIRRGDHLASIAAPGRFLARIPVHARDLPLFAERRVTATLMADGTVLSGQVTDISALRHSLPDGSTHEVGIRFDPVAKEIEPQPASCVFTENPVSAP